MAEEVQPKNIIMIGSTGVGKTEIARRLARLANSPFIKFEASKFTEVGYVGRDVESHHPRPDRNCGRHGPPGKGGPGRGKGRETCRGAAARPPCPRRRAPSNATARTRTPRSWRKSKRPRRNCASSCATASSTSRTVEIEIPERGFPSFEIISSQGMEEMDITFKDFFPNVFGGRTRKRKMRVDEAIDYLVMEEESKLIDMEQVAREAVERVEDSGIVFLDEIDKIAGRESGHGPEVSREGVQRDILPIVEGTTVSTRYGMIRTDHILFIAAGAFHVSKPSDLIPELQGRFPIRVEMDTLSEDDFVRILKEPQQRAAQAVFVPSGDRGNCAGFHGRRGARDRPFCRDSQRDD